MITARAGVHCNLNTALGRVPEVSSNGFHLRHIQENMPVAVSLNEGSLVLFPIMAFTFELSFSP